MAESSGSLIFQITMSSREDYSTTLHFVLKELLSAFPLKKQGKIFRAGGNTEESSATSSCGIQFWAPIYKKVNQKLIRDIQLEGVS